ncbi:MAG: hypothetical protein JSU59_06070 [Nitrospirota bacterium]|nr:MAG: hypothetical protein JSU59_06070 [Nitrospirota bacterium]
MSFVSSPRVPVYRITLFYGPELVQGVPKTLQCVFNVKKRSWKGGVQIVVAIEETQLVTAKQSLQFDHWVEETLSHVPHEEHADYALRAQDLFIQQVCHLKLQLAIQEGIRQENSKLDRQFLWKELDEAIVREESSIKDQVLTELDIHSCEESS